MGPLAAADTLGLPVRLVARASNMGRVRGPILACTLVAVSTPFSNLRVPVICSNFGNFGDSPADISDSLMEPFAPDRRVFHFSGRCASGSSGRATFSTTTFPPPASDCRMTFASSPSFFQGTNGINSVIGNSEESTISLIIGSFRQSCRRALALSEMLPRATLSFSTFICFGSSVIW